MKKKVPRPKYRICWECNRMLQANYHRVVTVAGEKYVVHADCAKAMDRAGRLDCPPETP